MIKATISLKNRRFDEKRATKSTFARTHREAHGCSQSSRFPTACQGARSSGNEIVTRQGRKIKTIASMWCENMHEYLSVRGDYPSLETLEVHSFPKARHKETVSFEEQKISERAFIGYDDDTLR